jgi:PEGA domain-containing protein
MKGSLVGTVLVLFAASTALADHAGARGSGGSGGGRSGGGHAVARSSGGGRSYGAGRSHGAGGYAGRGYAGRSAAGRGYASTGAERRQPRPGYGYGHGSYGHGGHYGHGYYGHGHYGHGYYGHGYYGYPYYGGYYGSYPWFSLGFYYGNGYGYAGSYYAPTYGYAYSYPAGDSYAAEPPPAYEDAPPVSSDTRREDVRTRGELRLDVRPDDASVYVDDRFVGSARELRTLALVPGPHRIEVVRPGFRTVERTVQVRLDVPADVVVELERQ